MIDEIKHYGVLGMHWGIRRYQPYPSGAKTKGKYIGESLSYQRTLNKMNQDKARETAGYLKNKQAGRSLQDKANRSTALGYTSRAKKARASANEKFKKAGEYKRAAREIDRAERRIAEEARKKGHKVLSEDFIRDGRTYSQGFLEASVSSIVGGTAGLITGSPITAATTTLSVTGAFESFDAKKYGEKYTANYLGNKVEQTPRAIVGKRYTVR